MANRNRVDKGTDKTPMNHDINALVKRLQEKDGAITGTALARLQNPEFAALVVGLKAASQEARVALESLSPPAGMVKDAERYRWLKDHVSPEKPGAWAHYVGCWVVNTMDVAIDAARERKE